MKIYFERSGGLMGRLVTGTVDTGSLPPEEAKVLREMVAAADFFELPESTKSASEGYDQFQYKLVVEDEDVRHTVETTDMAAPDALRPLLRRLTILTRSQHAKSDRFNQ